MPTRRVLFTNKSTKEVAPKKQPADATGPSQTPTHSLTHETENLKQQIEQLVAINAEQQVRQQAFEERISSLIERLTPASIPTPTRMPDLERSDHKNEQCLPKIHTPILTIDKVKGRSNYKTWIINTERTAKSYNVWNALIKPFPSLSSYKQDLALSIIILNVVPSIQSSLAGTPEDIQHADDLKYRWYSSYTKYLELRHVRHNRNFPTEIYKSHTTIEQITEFTHTPEDGLQAIFAGLLL